MAKAGKKLYYWDTACFISWLNGGADCNPEAFAGLEYIAKQINENKANLCTSVITQTEVLEGKFTSEQLDKLQNFFKRRNVSLVSVDSKIAQRGSFIRNYYSQRQIKIATPDSLHLATALIYQVDEFHTRDGDGKRPRRSDLLSLNGNVAGSPLHIRVPTAPELPLLAGVGPMPDEADESDLQAEFAEFKKLSPDADHPLIPAAKEEYAQSTQPPDIPPPAEVRGGDNGPPKDKADAEAAKEATASEGSKQGGTPNSEE